MKISDLVQIGKLGNKIVDGNKLRLRKSENFRKEFLGYKDIFLVFTDNRVRYVTVNCYEENSGKIYFTLMEKEVLEEIKRENNVRVMLDLEDDFFCKKRDYIDYILLFASNQVGRVLDLFNNGVYDVLICVTKGSEEFMIPVVDEYVERIDNENKVIFLKNFTSLINI